VSKIYNIVKMTTNTAPPISINLLLEQVITDNGAINAKKFETCKNNESLSTIETESQKKKKKVKIVT
jgi:hypothetical protein